MLSDVQISRLAERGGLRWYRHRRLTQAVEHGRKSGAILDATIYLYDLTSTYFEGLAAKNGKAKRGVSDHRAVTPYPGDGIYEKDIHCPLQWGRGTQAAENPVSRLKQQYIDYMLQWGRGTQAAENTAHGTLGGFCYDQLQWGRGTQAAENHGNNVSHMDLIKPLQWGRGTQAAENCRSGGRVSSPLRRFNEAAALRPAENAPHDKAHDSNIGDKPSQDRT